MLKNRRILVLIVAVLLVFTVVVFDLLDHLYYLTPRKATVAEPLWNSLVGFRGGLPEESFNFTESPPPWLSAPELALGAPARDPLVLRIAIISRPSEHERRAAVRKAVLQDVPKNEIQFEYKFFVGLPFTKSEWLDVEDQEDGVEEKVHMEAAKYGDLAILDLGEGHLYLGEKRWMMFEWGASVAPSTYDFFLGADTDAFLRLAAMNRRFHFLRPDANPRKDKIMWGHMLTHVRHWTPAEGNRSAEDPFYDGDWYSYPWGMAYMMSSALVGNLTAPGIQLPHHIKYAGDDIMIGSWVWQFAPDTDIIDDQKGFHDTPGRGWKEAPPIDYDAVCVHHVTANEMLALRARPEWDRSKEWERGGNRWWTALTSSSP